MRWVAPGGLARMADFAHTLRSAGVSGFCQFTGALALTTFFQTRG
jgi:hypothetical protein